MDKKITQKEYFTAIITCLNGGEVNLTTQELVDFCNSRIEQLDKKSTAKKPTKVQIANESLKTTILEILSDLENPATVSEILLDSRIEVGTSNQKVSALLKQMEEQDHTVTREKDKSGRSYFKAA